MCRSGACLKAMRTSSLPQKRDIGPHPKLMAREPTTPSPSRERAGVRGWMNKPYLRLRYFSRNPSGYSRRWDILHTRAGGGANREIGRAENEPLPLRPTRFNKAADKLSRRGHRWILLRRLRRGSVSQSKHRLSRPAVPVCGAVGVLHALAGAGVWAAAIRRKVLQSRTGAISPEGQFQDGWFQ